MKTNELRIGNCVYLQREKNEFTTEVIKGITEKYVIINFSSGRQYKKDYQIIYTEIQPIPLTEEWLLKLGFIKCSDYMSEDHDYYYPDLDGLWISADKLEVELLASDPYESFKLPLKVQYVHQLQNLYFALTGEELPIKQ